MLRMFGKFKSGRNIIQSLARRAASGGGRNHDAVVEMLDDCGAVAAKDRAGGKKNNEPACNGLEPSCWKHVDKAELARRVHETRDTKARGIQGTTANSEARMMKLVSELRQKVLRRILNQSVTVLSTFHDREVKESVPPICTKEVEVKDSAPIGHLEHIDSELTQNRLDIGSLHFQNGHSHEQVENLNDLLPGSITDPHQKLLSKAELALELYGKCKHTWQQSRGKEVQDDSDIQEELEQYTPPAMLAFQPYERLLFGGKNHGFLKASNQQCQIYTSLLKNCFELSAEFTWGPYTKFFRILEHKFYFHGFTVNLNVPENFSKKHMEAYYQARSLFSRTLEFPIHGFSDEMFLTNWCDIKCPWCLISSKFFAVYQWQAHGLRQGIPVEQFLKMGLLLSISWKESFEAGTPFPVGKVLTREEMKDSILRIVKAMKFNGLNLGRLFDVSIKCGNYLVPVKDPSSGLQAQEKKAASVCNFRIVLKPHHLLTENPTRAVIVPESLEMHDRFVFVGKVRVNRPR